MKTPPLANAAELERENRGTFERPPATVIAVLARGDLAKLCALGEPRRERFWVEVISRTGDAFAGMVVNEMLFTESHGLQLHDTIAFHADNIYSAIDAAEAAAAAAVNNPPARIVKFEY